MYYFPNAGNGYMTPQYQSTGLKGRPVSSLEEARAAQIDFDGSLFLFPDIANNRIYTKQISSDGLANLKMYELAEMPTGQNIDTSNYVTKEELNNALAQLKDSLTEKEEKPTSANAQNTAAPAFKF